MQDGYYTAKTDSFNDHGWSDFITIYVENNRIISVEYDAQNASGFIRSWDLAYQQQRDLSIGEDGNKLVRSLAKALITSQNIDAIKVLAGHDSVRLPFITLAQAAIKQSLNGDSNVTYVSLRENN